MTEFEIGDDEYTEEVNTSYDQNQPIGDEPQALNTEWSNSEPIDAKTGRDFLTINNGSEGWREKWDDIVSGDWIYTDEEKKELYGKEFKTVWQQLGYESLNQDGTGVRVATRGINVKKTPLKVIRFVYVSKSDCPICKPYDGHSWAIDSPNRPIIPRFETKHGNRPFTHPHCKCKWVGVFSDAESKSDEVNQADFDRTRKWYGIGFDKLTRMEQKMAMIDMLKQSLGMEKEAEEDIIDPTPIVSMAQIAFNAIKPVIKHKLGIEKAVESSYGIQNMLGDIVAKSLNKGEKKEIEESEDLTKDFSLDTLLGLIADRLSKKIGKKLGVESRATEGIPPEWYDQYFGTKDVGDFNPREGYQEVTYCKLCDEVLDIAGVEDMNKHLINRHGIEWVSATEGGKGSGRLGHQKWMLGTEVGEECPNCMMITERDNGKCTICGK